MTLREWWSSVETEPVTLVVLSEPAVTCAPVSPPPFDNGSSSSEWTVLPPVSSMMFGEPAEPFAASTLLFASYAAT